mmetsp:Transcript_81456/g.213847  ORF Transcript_81456/g.213847 Transcript_81456/m.213847 type:complete len:240 (-) Transcript_81456:529-1248(-)
MVLQKITTRLSCTLRSTPFFRCQASASTFSLITDACLWSLFISVSPCGVQSMSTCSHIGLTLWRPGPVCQARPFFGVVPGSAGAVTEGSMSNSWSCLRAISASVAVTKTNCVFDVNFCMRSSMVRFDSSCSSTSTSSRTTALQWLRSRAFHVSSNMRNFSRPGVATRMSVPAWSCFCCVYSLWPPVQQWTRKPFPLRAERTRATLVICSARSMVGARISIFSNGFSGLSPGSFWASSKT